jgi:hypothetical protein
VDARALRRHSHGEAASAASLGAHSGGSGWQPPSVAASSEYDPVVASGSFDVEASAEALTGSQIVRNS